jgi:hypothetical protein
VTLPQALRQPVKLRGDPWFGRAGGERGPLVHPWVTAEVIVANDTSEALRDGTIDVVVEDADGRGVGAVQLPVDVDAGTGFSYFDRIPEARLRDDPAAWVVGDEPPGTYYLRASISGPDGRVLSTNSYELAVLDTAFPELLALDPAALQAVLHGRGGAGFHFWAHGQLVHKAEPGVAGLVAGYRHAQRQGVDLWDVVQGEHFFRHLLEELHGLEEADVLVDTVWRIRSEIVSPAEKTAVLMRALERLIEQADRERQTRPARARGRKGQGGRPA